MHMNKVIGLLVLLCCELCFAIKVPIIWDGSGNSAVKNDPNDHVEIIRPQNVQTLQQSQSIPIEYFQYTAKKPQFAADIAAFHGVQNPQEHYKAYPVTPYTGTVKPTLGIHHMLNEDKTIYQPFQNYVEKTAVKTNHAHPMSTGYEIFHPYKAEEPALQEIYKDPTLNKIRNDLQDSKNRLQAYENIAGEPNISSDEYLEGQEVTDRKLFPQKNIPAPYELHRPERRPIYYRTPHRDSHRDHVLDQRFKHPWNQHNIKIRPMHYKPLKNHIHHLRQHHAMKYDDERNEYPQIQHSENIQEPQEGYDIYEKGKQKYTQLRNNVDESINKVKQQNRPVVYQKLELQKDEPEPADEDDEFVPIKNYAQVRKTETFKHVPRKTAFDDAETYEEIVNAPRLREAVKSTRAQTVYSEEGYEDSAYDHAGEQKHASDHEGHGGFLKENEKSSGLYKIPTVLGSYKDGKGSEYKDKIEHGKKWKTNKKDEKEETDAEDYSEDEIDESVDVNVYKDNHFGKRNKRDDEKTSDEDDASNDQIAEDRIDVQQVSNNNITIKNKTNMTSAEHELDKREANFKVPEINVDSTYLNEGDILELAKQKILDKTDNTKVKYPYYFKNLKSINKNSPLRYAENLKLMPKKSAGGTEFYDSRSIFECPEVDEDVDPIPEKLKTGKNPTEEDDNEEKDDESNKNEKEGFDTVKKQPRLNGLGDKIDCFKAKYFGENPLDSPFFKEEIISNPEPITAPKLPILKVFLNKKKENAQESKTNSVVNLPEKLGEVGKSDIFELLVKLRSDQSQLQENLNKSNSDLTAKLYTPQSILPTNSTQQTYVYTDILSNIKNDLQRLQGNINVPKSLLQSNIDNTNLTYNSFQNKEEVTKLPPNLRKKRAAPFVYEPYKIIRDSQFQDSKKTTTTSNISPLIRQLQSSRVVDRVSRSNRDDNQRQTKTNPSSRTYVDIGKKDRSKSNTIPTIVDISVDSRRGEPRYEIRPTNHKSEYTPVENKKTMSIEDYKTRTTTEKIEVITVNNEEPSLTSATNRQRVRQRTTVRPFYDVSSFLPKSTEAQNVAASNSIRKTVINTTPQTVSRETEQIKKKSDDDSSESEEDYDDDEDVEDEEEDAQTEVKVTTTTTTTTAKPTFRRRLRVSTTTEKPHEHRDKDEPERLRLVTRFRNYKPRENPSEIVDVTESPIVNEYRDKDDIDIPKYREKKKKSSESTLVTDTKKYGDDDDEDDEMKKEEVDALIGIKQNMDEYMPLYEKEEQDKERKRHQARGNKEDDNERRNDDDEYDEEEDDEDDDEEDDDEEDDDDDDDDNEEDEEQEDEKTDLKITTPEPTKRTLIRTTDAPPPTVASRIRTTTVSPHNFNPADKPIVTRKKIEIHKEIPVNKSSPHVTQYKQDIKEVEIIKETPTRRKPQKKVEQLELYKDDNLAKEINKLGDVEIFRENLDLDKTPKHGGNYRRASKEDLKLLKTRKENSSTIPPKDVEASQSENKKQVELDEYASQRMHGGNLKSLNDMKRSRNTGRSAKYTELSGTPVNTMHGGNLKLNNKRRGERKSEKLIELDDSHDDDDSSQDEDYKSSSHNLRNDRLHGGNYRSAKLVAQKDDEDIKVRNPVNEARRSATVLLNNFVQAVPALTTTPGYIVDPSKRMYYYVDT